MVWFVSHCHSESGRDRYVRRLAQLIGVHVYGRCGDRWARAGTRHLLTRDTFLRQEVRQRPAAEEPLRGGHGSVL